MITAQEFFKLQRPSTKVTTNYYFLYFRKARIKFFVKKIVKLVVKIFNLSNNNEIHINKTTRRNQYKNAILKGLPMTADCLCQNIFRNWIHFLKICPILPCRKLVSGGKRISGESISDENLKEIIDEVLNFEIPAKISENIYSLELFHITNDGFQRCWRKVYGKNDVLFLEGKPMKVIAATSGDTGSAVASGFFKFRELRFISFIQKEK
jgi:hypothetical protein